MYHHHQHQPWLHPSPHLIQWHCKTVLSFGSLSPYPSSHPPRTPHAKSWTCPTQIDCEMTGLDVESDRIIEIAVIITNGKLQAVDQGIQFVIRTEKNVLDNMGEWCVDQHGVSFLFRPTLIWNLQPDPPFLSFLIALWINSGMHIIPSLIWTSQNRRIRLHQEMDTWKADWRFGWF